LIEGILPVSFAILNYLILKVKISLRRLSNNPSNACHCHSEPFGKLRTVSAKKVIVILSNAKDL